MWVSTVKENIWDHIRNQNSIEKQFIYVKQGIDEISDTFWMSTHNEIPTSQTEAYEIFNPLASKVGSFCKQEVPNKIKWSLDQVKEADEEIQKLEASLHLLESLEEDSMNPYIAQHRHGMISDTVNQTDIQEEGKNEFYSSIENLLHISAFRQGKIRDLKSSLTSFIKNFDQEEETQATGIGKPTLTPPVPKRIKRSQFRKEVMPENKILTDTVVKKFKEIWITFNKGRTNDLRKSLMNLPANDFNELLTKIDSIKNHKQTIFKNRRKGKERLWKVSDIISINGDGNNKIYAITFNSHTLSLSKHPKSQDFFIIDTLS